MNIGMLWFDNDPKAGLSSKVERAAAYYRNKYGKTPNLCYVHPSMLPAPAQPANENNAFIAAGVELRSNRAVLPNHFWLGINIPAEASH